MEQSALFQLVQSFSSAEQKELKVYLRSPFFNRREDLVLLFELLTDDAPPDKTVCWQRIFGKQPYEDQKMRLLMSYLLKLLEQYLAIREFQQDKFQSERYLSAAYRKRGLLAASERTQSDLERVLQQDPVKDVRYFQFRYELGWEAYRRDVIQDPTEVSRLHGLSEISDIVYLVQKLRILCLLTAHEGVYHAAHRVDWAETAIHLAAPYVERGVAAVRIYVQCYRMLHNPSEESFFQDFKISLLDDATRFGTEEMHALYIWAINYCVRRLNDGEPRFSREALDLYRQGLERGFLLENGLLSRFTYHNIVAIGLQTGDHDWVRYFIHAYKLALEKKYRDSSFSFNLARLEYSDGRFDQVLRLLQTANYRDPLLNLSAKTLLLKTYYTLGETDLLQSHLDAMRNYIHRKRVIGYHRTNYLNIIRYTEKLLRLNRYDRTGIDQFRQAVEKEQVLTEKGFFLKAMGEGRI